MNVRGFLRMIGSPCSRGRPGCARCGRGTFLSGRLTDDAVPDGTREDPVPLAERLVEALQVSEPDHPGYGLDWTCRAREQMVGTAHTPIPDVGHGRDAELRAEQPRQVVVGQSDRSGD